jgi:hypothetical protein
MINIIRMYSYTISPIRILFRRTSTFFDPKFRCNHKFPRNLNISVKMRTHKIFVRVIQLHLVFVKFIKLGQIIRILIWSLLFSFLERNSTVEIIYPSILTREKVIRCKSSDSIWNLKATIPTFKSCRNLKILSYLVLVLKSSHIRGDILWVDVGVIKGCSHVGSSTLPVKTGVF